MKGRFALNRIAAILAFAIGMLAIFAGGQVLLGRLPDYYVIGWLPVYNFAAGLASAFLAAILLWKNHPLSMPVVIAIFGLHAVVMVVLLAAYHKVVAPDSLQAMTVRMVVWGIILTLLFIQQGIHKTKEKSV